MTLLGACFNHPDLPAVAQHFEDGGWVDLCSLCMLRLEKAGPKRGDKCWRSECKESITHRVYSRTPLSFELLGSRATATAETYLCTPHALEESLNDNMIIEELP